MSEQNIKNHVKLVPPFHFFVLPILAINFVWSLFRLRLTFAGIFGVIFALALMLLALNARLFALKVQDRLIRLEERLRYERVLPEELRWRADELTVDQFVSLRFASDEELPALMRKVLDDKLTERKAIKQLIKNWRADYLRA
ncbi:MAG: hypothetical protein DMG36_02135 [Acidobacteria bacterium]|nr:MAG: hypothetical protein DMG36_02135 [Acidobacteriota bacterium]